MTDERRPGKESLPGLRRAMIVSVASLGLLSLLCALGVMAVPFFNMELFNLVLPTRDVGSMWSLWGGLVIAVAAYSAVAHIRHRALVVVSNQVARRLSVPLIEVAAGSSSGPAAALGAMRDLETLRVFLSSPVCLAPFELAWTPLLLCVFLFMHWGYGALALVCLVVYGGLNMAGDMVTGQGMRAANEAAAEGFRSAASAVSASEAVVAMGMIPAISARWGDSQSRSLEMSHRAVMRSKLVGSIMRATRLGMTAAMVALGLILVLGGMASSGTMVAGNMILAKLLAPMQSIANTRRSWSDARLAWARIKAVLEEAVPVRYERAMPAPEGRLEVDRVAFMPAGAERPVLRGVSFSVAPGEVLGIVGPAAAGKSTLLKLLLGIERPTSGGVFLDGHSTSLWQREDFVRHVGYVPQSVSLVPGTVADNIAAMRQPDLARVIQAAKEAGVHDAVVGLPFGYATQITADGFTLSAGQRQRVALARALYGNPRLVVLDEPNAFLDKAGEEELLDLVLRLKARGVGCVLVTHRPSLTRAADKLLVLRDGLVDRHGSRDDVLKALSRPAVSLVRAVAR